MRSLQESNLIVFWRRLLLVDILLLSLSTQLSWAAEIKIRLESEDNSGYEKVDMLLETDDLYQEF